MEAVFCFENVRMYVLGSLAVEEYSMKATGYLNKGNSTYPKDQIVLEWFERCSDRSVATADDSGPPSDNMCPAIIMVESHTLAASGNHTGKSPVESDEICNYLGLEFFERIILTATVPPDENTPIILMNREMGLLRKKNIAPFISSPVHMLCCPLPAVATMP
ncbi:hypothetical protein TNCV_2381781 [Trichonephila clavipes]|nr:hypothetical protein TNCV_2381781 [Trichonephila clavipes]